MNEFGECTCGCPDGEGLHLENCESYLRSWELQDLANIERELRRIISYLPAREVDRNTVDFLLASIGHFVNSTRKLGEAAISDPLGVIRNRMDAKGNRLTGATQ